MMVEFGSVCLSGRYGSGTGSAMKDYRNIMLTSMELIGTTPTINLQEIFEHPIGMTYTIVPTTKNHH